MKKLLLRQIIIASVAFASIVACIFLNTVVIKEKTMLEIEYVSPKVPDNIDDDKEVQRSSGNILPDVSAVQRIISLVKKFVPAA